MLIVLGLTLDTETLFLRKRAVKLYTKYKIAYFYVKIGLWILTTNFNANSTSYIYMLTLVGKQL